MGRFKKTTMTRGILIYAFNNESIDYWKQATWCADRVNRYLDLPVTIVTDKNSQAERSCDHSVLFTESSVGGLRVYDPLKNQRADSWFNGNRFQSFDITPYDETIVIDSDYIIASNQLRTLFDLPVSVTSIRDVYDITNRDSFRNYQTVSNGKVGLHHWWATVLFFRRNRESEHFFTIMRMVRENYRHYSNLYRFRPSPFRNDFAVSISITAISGHCPSAVNPIPWAMANVGADVEIIQKNHDCFELSYLCYKTNQPRRLIISGQDFHFMNKQSLSNLYADPS
jgi:hypothetical protein